MALCAGCPCVYMFLCCRREFLCAVRSRQATLQTMQVPLNGDDEYDGGRLLFATRKGLECPARPVDVMVVASPDL